MKSFMAALRSLVLPYGTTSGQRLVLDGTNGRIQVYNSSNVLIAEISPTADVIKVYGADGSWVALDPSTASGIADTPGPGLALSKPTGDAAPATLSEFDDTFTRGAYLRSPSPVADPGASEGQDYSAISMTGRYHGNDPQIRIVATGPNSSIAINDTIIGPDGTITAYGAPWNTYTPSFGGDGSATYSTRTGWWRRWGDEIQFAAYAVVGTAGSGTGNVTITAPTAIDRTTRQRVAAHTEGLTAGNNGSSTALAFMGGTSPSTFDRIRNYSNGTITGADLLSGGIILVEGRYRQG